MRLNNSASTASRFLIVTLISLAFAPVHASASQTIMTCTALYSIEKLDSHETTPWTELLAKPSLELKPVPNGEMSYAWIQADPMIQGHSIHLSAYGMYRTQSGFGNINLSLFDPESKANVQCTSNIDRQARTATNTLHLELPIKAPSGKSTLKIDFHCFIDG